MNEITSVFLITRYLASIGFFCVAQCLLAQQPPIQSLEELHSQIAASQGAERTELRLKLLKRVDNTALERMEVAVSIIDEYRQRNDPRVLSLALMAKGSSLGQVGDFANAIKTLEEAEVEAQKCSDTNPEVFFKARSNRALYMVTLGHKTEAIALLLDLIDFAKPYGDRLSVGHAYITLATLAESSGSTAKALEYLQTSFELSTSANQPYVAGAAGDTIVSLLIGDGQYEAAEKWVGSAEPWVNQSNNPLLIFSFTVRREELRTVTGDANVAVANLRKLLLSASEAIEPQMIGLANYALANAEFKRKNYAEAIDAATEAIRRYQNYPRSRFLAEGIRLEAKLENGEAAQVAEELTKLIVESKAFGLPAIRLKLLLSGVYERLGKYSEALSELRQANLLETERLKERAQEQASFMTAIFDDRERENQLSLLKEKQLVYESNAKLIEAKAEQQTKLAGYATRTRNVIVVLCGFVLLASTILIFALSKFRESQKIAIREKQLNDDLNQKFCNQAAALRQEEEARRLLELTVERKQRDEALGKLTSGVAHDFNNLLTVVLNSNEVILMKEPNLPGVVQQMLASSTKAAQSGAAIIKQLMAYTKQQSLVTKPVNVSDWLQSVKGLFRQTIGESSTLHLRDLSDGAVIKIDDAQLTTAVINLLANARDAISTNGSIEFTIQKIELGSSDLSDWEAASLGEYVQFEIKDNGAGIPAELIPRVCDPFYTTKQAKSGTGLGLSSVLGFVRQSNGDFCLKSELGKGTSAKFILPLCNIEIVSERIADQEQRPVRNGSILLVEDQEFVRQSTSFLLKLLGYQVFEADGSESAIRFFHEASPPDIVISDVQMPGVMDGIGLRHWIQTRYPKVRVILSSGYSESHFEIGEDFLPKPFSLDALAAILDGKTNS